MTENIIVPIVQCPGLLICLWSGAQCRWSEWHWTPDNACDTPSQTGLLSSHLSAHHICPLCLRQAVFCSKSRLLCDPLWIVDDKIPVVTILCVDVWPPHQCSDLVWWNSAEILINGIHSSTALHSSQRLIEKFAGDYQDTKPGSGLSWSYLQSACHKLVFLVLSKLFLAIKHHGGGEPSCVVWHYIQLWFLQFPFKFKLERF